MKLFNEERLSSKDVYVVGINENHDASVALSKDGRIIAAICQERISRIKHHENEFYDAFCYVMNAAHISISDLAAGVFCVHGAEGNLKNRRETSLKQYLRKKMPIFHYHQSHHDLHALSAFYLSPFTEAAIMVCDGLGSELKYIYNDLDGVLIENDKDLGFLLQNRYYEGESYYYASGTQLDPISKKMSSHFPYEFVKEDISLGRLYNYVSKYVFETRYDAGKVMALAAYGTKSAREDLFVKKTKNIINIPNDKLKVFASRRANNKDPLVHSSLALAVQSSLEEALVYKAKWLRHQTKSKNLCIAGGVGLNCLANTRILFEGGFKRVFIMPAASDDGIAIGGALFGYYNLLSMSRRRGPKSFYPYLGREYTQDEIKDAIDKYKATFGSFRVHNYNDFSGLCDEATDALCEGKILLWFQEKSEFGPRALGNRSILANPSIRSVKDFLNTEIKGRHAFSPFAPAVLENCVNEYFEVPPRFKSPYMLFNFKVKNHVIKKIPAVLHLDNTARIQTVSKQMNPRFYILIQTFCRKTGIPILLNTSFNGKNEPIVETPDDALEFFLTSKTPILVIGDYLLEKQ